MSKTIIAFLQKEPMADKVSNTNGDKLFYGNTCVGQWKEHSVLINNSLYNQKDIDDFIEVLKKQADKSLLIVKTCAEYVPMNSKELKSYE